MSTRESWRAPRMGRRLRVTLREPDGEWKLVSTSASETGLGLIGELALSPGHCVQGDIDVPDCGRVPFRAEVMWARRSSPRRTQMGMRFLEPMPAAYVAFLRTELEAARPFGTTPTLPKVRAPEAAWPFGTTPTLPNVAAREAGIDPSAPAGAPEPGPTPPLKAPTVIQTTVCVGDLATTGGPSCLSLGRARALVEEAFTLAMAQKNPDDAAVTVGMKLEISVDRTPVALGSPIRVTAVPIVGDREEQRFAAVISDGTRTLASARYARRVWRPG